MAIQKPLPSTDKEKLGLKECLSIDVETFQNMIGPKVELIERYIHHGPDFDYGTDDGLKERAKYAPIYGLVGGIGSIDRYERYFALHGYSLYTTDMLQDLFTLLALHFRDDDFYYYEEWEKSVEKAKTEHLPLAKKVRKSGRKGS